MMRRDDSPGATTKDREAHLMDAIQSEALRAALSEAHGLASVRIFFKPFICGFALSGSHSLRSCASAPAAQTPLLTQEGSWDAYSHFACESERQSTCEIRDLSSPRAVTNAGKRPDSRRRLKPAPTVQQRLVGVGFSRGIR